MNTVSKFWKQNNINESIFINLFSPDSFSVSWEDNGSCGAENRDSHMQWKRDEVTARLVNNSSHVIFFCLHFFFFFQLQKEDFPFLKIFSANLFLPLLEKSTTSETVYGN